MANNQEPNYNYTPPQNYYQQQPPNQNQSRNCGGCLTGLAILIVALTIAILTIFFVVKPAVDKMIADLGGTNLKQIVTLYKEVTARVDEDDVVKHGYKSEDYSSAQNKLETAGLKIFDENNNIVPGLIGDFVFNSIELSDKEMAALINNILDAYIKNSNIPFYNTLKLDTSVKQIKIEPTVDANHFKISIIVLANTDELTKQMGILGGLIPQNLYLTSTANYNFTGNSTSYTDSKIVLNKIKDSSFQELLNIVSKSIGDFDEPLQLQAFSNTISQLVCDGFKALENVLNADINLVNGGVVSTQNSEL